MRIGNRSITAGGGRWFLWVSYKVYSAPKVYHRVRQFGWGRVFVNVWHVMCSEDEIQKAVTKRQESWARLPERSVNTSSTGVRDGR